MNFKNNLIKYLKNKVRPWWYFTWIGILCIDKLGESCRLWSVGCSDLFIHVLKKLISVASYVLAVSKVLAYCQPWPLSSQSLFWTLFKKSLMHRWELNCGHRVAASGSLLIDMMRTWDSSAHFSQWVLEPRTILYHLCKAPRGCPPSSVCPSGDILGAWWMTQYRRNWK